MVKGQPKKRLLNEREWVTGALCQGGMRQSTERGKANGGEQLMRRSKFKKKRVRTSEK